MSFFDLCRMTRPIDWFSKDAMPLTLKRMSLAVQAADSIRSEIMRNRWKVWIPSERELSRILRISRNSCRGALRILQHEKLIKPVRGRGSRMTRSAVRKQGRLASFDHSVGILIPTAMSQLQPLTILLIDELKSELFDLDVSVQLHHSPAVYRSNSMIAFEKLIENNKHDCWILIKTKETIQKWFMKQKVPCVVSGSLHPGIILPSADLDYRAICRHAAGQLISFGHRRLVFFNRRSRAAGDLESEAGFLEGASNSSNSDVVARVMYHDDNLESIGNLIQSLYSSARPPTGIFIANSFCYLSVASILAKRGIRVPEDVSLISRDDDSFMAYLEPAATRYHMDAGAFAHKCMALIRPLLEGGITKLEPVRVLPKFIPGGSCRVI